MVYLNNCVSCWSMSKIFELLQAVETVREKISETEYLNIVRLIDNVRKDYFPGIQTVESYPMTPKEVVVLVKEFLSGESRIQTEVACYLLNTSSEYCYTEYGFQSFKEWMEYLGFYVSLNRVFEI